MERINPFLLERKTILITGGAGGIGSSVAKLCAQLGARVVLTDIREDALSSTLALLPESQTGEPHLCFPADLTDADQLAALVEFCPQLDGLVCNAGVMKLTLTQFITEDELTRMFRVSVANGIYATTKCGIDAFMRTVALELGPKGIRCNSVNPGMVETALIGSFTEEQKEKEKLNYPLRRFAQPVDIANGIVYLLSDASSFVTGTALKIDGGMTLG